MKTITIHVSPDVADSYEKADERERNRVEKYINAWLDDIFSNQSANKRLSDIMEKASAEAKRKGFKPEMLEGLLKDDE